MTDSESNKTLVKLCRPPKQASTKAKTTDAESNKTQLGQKKKYFALMDWSSVGDLPFLKADSDAYMDGDLNQ